MNALILGSAACLFDDLAALRGIVDPWPGIVIAVNRAAIYYTGHIDHWASLHAAEFPVWQADRGNRGDSPVTWSRAHRKGSIHHGIADRIAEHWRGSSGLFGLSVARELGARKAILCGVPIDPIPHVGESLNWHGAARYWADWRERAAMLRPWVRSMSGWTASLLGMPTREWINEREAA